MQSFCYLLRRVAPLCLFVSSLLLLSSDINAQNCQSNNFAANKPVVSSESGDLAPNLVDGNLLTDWYGPSDSKWIYVDLGQSQNLCRVTLKWGIWTTLTETRVQCSNDATTWIDFYTIAAGTQANHVNTGDPNNDYDYINVDFSSATTPYRYVRLYYPSNTPWGPHIKELEVYIKAPTVTPSVSLTRPTNGNTYLQGSTINMAASASEQGGSISKVEFYANSTLLGQSTVAPFTFNWTNIQAGDYNITARAYDPSNQASASNAVSIHVAIPGWSLSGNGAVSATSFIGTTDANPLIFKTNNQERLKITSSGVVAINSANDANLPGDAALAVEGLVYAKKLRITQSSWADFVFDSAYRLTPLLEVEKFINSNKHLPGVPSEKQIAAEGVSVGDNQAILLQKIEELTLYMIELHKELDKLKQENEQLKKHEGNVK